MADNKGKKERTDQEILADLPEDFDPMSNEITDEQLAAFFGDDAVSGDSPLRDGAEKPLRKQGRIMAYSSDKFSVVRDVPKVIIQMAKGAFPEAKSQTDALVAYLYCYCPEIAANNSLKGVLTGAQKELIREHEGGAYADMASRLLDIKKKLDAQTADNALMKMLLCHIVYDRFGFKDCNPDHDDISEVDFFERNGLLIDFAIMVEQAAKEFRQRKNVKTGRPFDF